MEKYLCKKVYFRNGKIKGLDVKGRIEGGHRPRSQEYVILRGEFFEFPKVSRVDGEFVIVEDIATKRAQKYKRMRSKAYPKLSEQLDSIFKVLKYLKNNGTAIGLDGDGYVDAIQAVKDAHPKPEVAPAPETTP